ncbi:protocadherin Fat 3 [Microcaecilia unicolor]|uniref:Protocadherin Fat 3-like n=1 Tax=Microcaecilia unicolor TaxID=1415580 RepID=A0A6P7YWS3_9AMPH|nr:protocadherin Fat 3-like [Microcaecilia unicolor]
MAATGKRRDSKYLILFCFLILAVCKVGFGQIRYSIPEEMRKGTFVGNIAKDLRLDVKELSDLAARIVSRGRTQYIALNFKTGHLIVKERIDREEICRQASQCLLNVDIVLEDRVKIYAVEVMIQDVNDNSPMFPNEEIELKISEFTTPGTRYLLQDAQDLDVGNNSLLSYQLSKNKYFTLDVQTGVGGVKYAELVLEKSLDREEQAGHHLILTATDGGDPVRSGTAQIHVVVLDANDNAPVFNQSVYKVEVLENVPIGTVVATLNATDKDEGIHSEITYLFRKFTDKASQIFQLNSKTGIILVVGELDFEESEAYEMEVQANDGGGLSARCKVLIQVINLNDNLPELTVTSLFSPVIENSPAGTVVALLNVHDRDSGENGHVTCFIGGNLPFELNKSSFNFYSLLTKRKLDREQVSEYNITITATDKGTPPLSTSKSILLLVSDKNDNPPTFDQSSYTVYVKENVPAGTSIYSTKATDLDWGQNSRITYSVADGQFNEAPLSSYISINSETGVLYTIRSFDYEQFRDFQIQVKAEDGGSPPLRSNVTINIFIVDQNDNSPEILYPSFPTDGSTGVELAPRSYEPGYLVTKVIAVDPDSGQNAWLSYILLTSTEPGLFTVGLHTGEIRTASSFLDKHAMKQTLVVLVKDNGQPSLSATVTVTIMVTDSIQDILSDMSNMSSPIDTESNLTVYLVIAIATISCLFFIFILLLLAIKIRKWRESQLFESSNINFSAVPTSRYIGVEGVKEFLQTQDLCLTTNSEKNLFQYLNSNHSDTLAINNVSEKQASLLITEPLNISDQDQCLFQISRILNIIQTTGFCILFLTMAVLHIKQREAEWSVTRQVLFSILFCLCPGASRQIRYSIPEEMEIGSPVGNIANDLGLNLKEFSSRSFRIASSSKKQYFALNAENGNLYVNDRIDRERMCGESINCFLSIEAIVENPLNVFHVQVTILDINDNEPSFFNNNIELEIIESISPGARFSLGNARDPDIGTNSLQNYQLSPNPFFTLEEKESSDGKRYAELVLEKPLDREKQSTFNFLLSASDGGDPIRTGTAQVNIKVTDANDNFPIFIQNIYTTNLKENTPIGFTVLQLNANDLDEGSNAEITYSFKNMPDFASQILSLGSKSGEMVIIGHIDFEEIRQIQMDVEAKDGGGLASHCTVIIEVFDENDNAPEITLTSLSTTIPEDSPPGTVIALIKVDDLDYGENGEVVCHIQDGFPVKLTSSSSNYYKIITDSALDREQISEYNVTIIATDKGYPPLSTSKTIPIKITDINDNAPIFEQMSYKVYVPENNLSGASIFIVNASDPDFDQNSRITYSIVNSNIEKLPVSSYVSINSQTGIIYAQRSFDYEQFREFQFQVEAQDSGSPSLYSNSTVKVFIMDRNDNAPKILYPSVGSDGSALFEMVSPSTEKGSLVTKVVAVDADSGHNAWLSYQLLQATEPALFSIGVHSGEIRTSRSFIDRDAVKQKLVILVHDNGKPPLSTTVTVNMIFAENIQGVLPELSNQSRDLESPSELNFYLVMSLALISFLFLVTILLLLIKKCLSSRKSTGLEFLSSDIYSQADPRFVTQYSEGTLPYTYQLCTATESGKNEFTFLEPNAEMLDGIIFADLSAKQDWSKQDTSGKFETNTYHEIVHRNL